MRLAARRAVWDWFHVSGDGDGDVRVLTFYRADGSRGIGRKVVFSGIVMSLGALAVASSFASFAHGGSQELHETLFAVGISLVVFGGLTTIVGLTRALRDETCVVARTDGVVLLANGDERFVAWSDLESVRFDATANVVVLATTSGDAHRLEDRAYGDTALPELARALDGMRRKAAWNLLKP